jgi:hypothetical protein
LQRFWEIVMLHLKILKHEFTLSPRAAAALADNIVRSRNGPRRVCHWLRGKRPDQLREMLPTDSRFSFLIDDDTFWIPEARLAELEEAALAAADSRDARFEMVRRLKPLKSQPVCVVDLRDYYAPRRISWR